jgi:hypothetical protein
MTQIGKTDYDFLPEDVADTYRNSDIEVVKIRELKDGRNYPQKIATHLHSCKVSIV